eukprot:4285637-Amphidinium_carterae.1
MDGLTTELLPPETSAKKSITGVKGMAEVPTSTCKCRMGLVSKLPSQVLNVARSRQVEPLVPMNPTVLGCCARSVLTRTQSAHLCQVTTMPWLLLIDTAATAITVLLAIVACWTATAVMHS